MFGSVLVCCVIALCAGGSDGANILGVAFVPSFSHQTVFQPVWKELSLRGHKVTTISSFLLNDPSLTNLKEIDVSKETLAAHARYNVNTWGSTKENKTKSLSDFMDVTMDIYDALFSAPQVQSLLHDKNTKFDLVIMESIMPTGYAFMEHFNCPGIGITSIKLIDDVLMQHGSPVNPAIYPSLMVAAGKTLKTFTDRVMNVFTFLMFKMYTTLGVTRYDDQIKRYFPENKIMTNDLTAKLSLMIMTNNPALEVVRSHSPKIIPVTGLNIRPEKPLPKDMKKFMDESKNGVVYLSFGTNIKSSLLPQDRRDCLLGAIAELPYDVIWKFETDNLPNIPKNLMIVKWAPQQDILRHPNVKLFVTHAGLQSTEEATHFGIPLLAIPFFGDQEANAMKIVDAGIGLHLDYFTMTKETFRDHMLEVAGNKQYKEKSLYYKRIIEDKPMSDLDNAVWWIEYVIRHKGAPHLNPHVLNVPFWQYFMLDIIAATAVGGFLIIYIFIKFTKLLLNTRHYL